MGGFVEHLDMTPEQSYDLIMRAVDLAKQARTLYLEEYEDYIQNGKDVQPRNLNNKSFTHALVQFQP